jgi:hypothetical protein
MNYGKKNTLYVTLEHPDFPDWDWEDIYHSQENACKHTSSDIRKDGRILIGDDRKTFEVVKIDFFSSRNDGVVYWVSIPCEKNGEEWELVLPFDNTLIKRVSNSRFYTIEEIISYIKKKY